MNVNFTWKRLIPSVDYFRHVFEELWPEIKEKLLYRTYVLQDSHFFVKLPLAPCGTFLFSKFVCIRFLILHAKIQCLKDRNESQVVALESFSIELRETIVRKCSKNR